MLFRLGVNISRQAPPEDVLSLIQRLHPIDPGIPLIRLGGAGEGGYLIPDDLEGIEYCFSPGVSDLADFESDLADRNIKCFLADASVERPPVIRPEFRFDKKFLGASDQGDFFTLRSWKNKYLAGYTGDLILQMDIEGYEYPVILSTPDELLDQFRIIVVEFHGVTKIFDPRDLIILSATFEKLLKYFYVVHSHPNNAPNSLRVRRGVEVPDLLEMTFLNRRRVKDWKPATTFPHPLDAINNVHAKPIPLPRGWYGPVD
jgi:hypothetical protein